MCFTTLVRVLSIKKKLETLIISCSLRENYLIFEVQYKHNYYEHMIQEATYDVPVMLGKIFIFMTLYTLLLDSMTHLDR